jgi:hypothetical protein
MPRSKQKTAEFNLKYLANIKVSLLVTFLILLAVVLKLGIILINNATPEQEQLSASPPPELPSF